MKKSFAISVAILVATASSANAAVVKSARERLVDYTKQARQHVYGKAGSAKGLSESALKEVKENLLRQMEMPHMVGKLRPVLSGKGAAERMDNLVTIIAVKKMSVEIGKKDMAESKSLNAAAEASAKLLANSDTVGIKQSKDLNSSETITASQALQKAESLPTKILTEFSKAERDSYTQVIERYDQLNQMVSKKSAEDNFIQAIMETRKVDRAKALEIAKKLKECV